MPTVPDAVVVNLTEVRSVCRRVAGWYDEALAGRDPGPVALEDVLAAVRALPLMGGRVGRALTALSDPPPMLTRGEFFDALGCVRRVAGELPGQLCLPGVD